MIELLLAGLLLTTPGQATASQSSQPAVVLEDPVRLEDLEVSGRGLDSLIRDFVTEVAAPNPNRGLARWSNGICVGVANLQNDAARYIVDRVSTVAEDLGLTPGAPGCRPDVIIIATDDADGLARELIDQNRRAFRIQGAGTDRGGAELRRFETSDRPVRWWQVSMPVDSETGVRATRLPSDGYDAGDGRGRTPQILNYAPTIRVTPSRLSTQIHDNLFRTILLVDVAQVEQVSIQQLADYIAMVTFAQINPEADTSRYASVLNVFEDSESADGLTEWDKAYLEGLYDAERNKKNFRAGRAEIIASIHRAHAQIVDKQQP